MERVFACGRAPRNRARGEEAQTVKHEAGFLAHRQPVERSHGQMNRFRRALIRWEKKLENHPGLPYLVCARISCRQPTRRGRLLNGAAPSDRIRGIAS